MAQVVPEEVDEPSLGNRQNSQSEKRLGYPRLLAINAFWFGNGAHWQPIFISLLPLGAKLVDEPHKELIVGRATAAGGVFALLVPVLVGWLSDRTATRWGRRRPWMVGGAILNVVGLMLLSLAFTPVLVIALYLVVQAGNNAAGAAYTGVIPDVVPEVERGRASGLLGMMNSVGTVVGLVFAVGLLALLGSTRTGLVASYLALSAVLLLTLVITCLGTHEIPIARHPAERHKTIDSKLAVCVLAGLLTVVAIVTAFLVPETFWPDLGLMLTGGAVTIATGARIPAARKFLAPFTNGDFLWTFLTRTFVQFGIFSILPFIDFYFGDVMHVKSPDVQSSLWLLLVLAGGIVPSIYCGMLSDRMKRRKIFVYVSGAMQALVVSVLLFGLITSLPVMYALGFIYGVGYGIYYAVDWALACDVLPSGKKEAGKEMALWHISFTLPQVVAPALLAPILYYMNQAGHSVGGVATGNNLGYRLIFGSAALWFILGTLMVRQIRKVR